MKWWVPLSVVLIIFLFIASILISTPSSGSNWTDELGIDSVSLYNNDTLLKKYLSDSLTVTFVEPKPVDQVIVVAIYAPTEPGYNWSGDLFTVELSITNTTGGVIYPTGGTQPDWPWTGENVTVDYILINGLWYTKLTVFFNFTVPSDTYWFDDAGNYVIRVDYEIITPSLEASYVWDLSLYIYLPPESIEPTTYNIGQKIIFLIWIMIIFLPALILNSIIPKMGFIAGMIITPIALLVAGTMELWLFAVIMIGLVIIIFRGDRE